MYFCNDWCYITKMGRYFFLGEGGFKKRKEKGGGRERRGKKQKKMPQRVNKRQETSIQFFFSIQINESFHNKLTTDWNEKSDIR